MNPRRPSRDAKGVRPEPANCLSVRSQEPRHPLVPPASRLGQKLLSLGPEDRRTPMLCHAHGSGCAGASTKRIAGSTPFHGGADIEQFATQRPLVLERLDF